MPKRKKNEIELYDWVPGSTPGTALIYAGRKPDKTDPGVMRLFSTPGTADDPLCKLWWGDMLMGDALEEAKRVCPVKPEGFVLPARFIKQEAPPGAWDYG